MSVRAKFKVDRIERSSHTRYVNEGDKINRPVKSELQTIVMSPVYSGDPNSENKQFWDATPSGELRLGTINPDAGNYFELNGEYYIHITKA